MELNLPPPIGRDSPSFEAWINDNIRILSEAFGKVKDHAIGRSSVTGTGTIATGLFRVDFVVASFDGDATIGAMTLNARPSPTAGAILIKVWAFNPTGPALAASTTPINVAWAAFGLRI